MLWNPLHLNLSPCFISAFSLATQETTCYLLSLCFCRSFNVFLSLSPSLSPAVCVCVFPLSSFHCGTMVGAFLCMMVINFYDVAMSMVFMLPWPPLCSTCHFITPLCSEQLVCRDTSCPTSCCHCPAISFQTSAQKDCAFTEGMKISWLMQISFLSVGGAVSDLPFKD